ncbi:MAG: hypothetical protein Q7P63_13685 [Verrucomicrobiota bacterium JB022]|nr:hypothetical protein [Verrucomicrobiota bacterium JB022]
MKQILPYISYVGLALSIIPPVLVFMGVIDIDFHYTLMAVGMLLWFGTAPFWMKPTDLEEKEPEETTGRI